MNITVLKKRRDFLAVAQSGLYQASPALVVQCLLRDDEKDGCGQEQIEQTKSHCDAFDVPSLYAPQIRFGFTASKKVGNAVERNFAKRRLRVLARFACVQKVLLSGVLQSGIVPPGVLQSDVLPPGSGRSCDFVLIARKAILKRPFAHVEQDLSFALERLSRKILRAG